MKEIQKVNEKLYTETEYLKIMCYFRKDRATPIFDVYNKSNEDKIAEIKWFAHWRKYCFYPYVDTVWDSKCLYDLYELLQKINKEYFLLRLT